MKAAVNQSSTPERVLRIREVVERTGRSRSMVYDDIKAGRFPAPIRIGLRAVAWRQGDIDRWIETRPSAR